MKRILMAVALVAAIAVPTTAIGASEGQGAARAGSPGLLVEFTLESVGNKPVAIKKFKFSGLEVICNGGISKVVSGRIGAIRVRDDRRFGTTVKRNGKKVRVAGKVRAAKVVGTIRASGTFGTATGCNSGRVRWVAQ